MLSVNGKPIYVRGANWIPDDAFVTRLTPDDVPDQHRGRGRRRDEPAARLGRRDLRERRLLRRLRRAGNPGLAGLPVRVCGVLRGRAAAKRGGGRGARGRHAARAGTPAWRCGTATTRTSGGTSSGAGGSRSPGGRGARATTSSCCPQIVAELDPRTPYSPGSPYSFDRVHPPERRARTATMHIWDVWNQVDYTTYRKYKPRFVSEFGFQGPPAWSTLTSVVHDSPLDPYGAQMLVHQKAFEGNLKLERGLGDHLPAWKRHGRLALDDSAEPGAGGCLRHRALPQPVPAEHRRGRLAAERQLAGRLLGRRRRARDPQAAVVRLEARVRRPAADRPAAGERTGRCRTQRHGRRPGRPRSPSPDGRPRRREVLAQETFMLEVEPRSAL